MIKLTEKTILVTGASSGIGRETARFLASLGATIILLARSEARLSEVLEELPGVGHVYYCFDLAAIDEIDSKVADIVSLSGPLSGCVHCAGVGGVRPLKMLKPSFLQAVMTVNFSSFVELMRAVSQRGRFVEGTGSVAISSVASLQGSAGKAAYCASKAALDASVRCLAKELAPKKIRVNSILPGLIKTEMNEQFQARSALSDDARAIALRQYMGLGAPIDVAKMVAYLLSDSASFISGTNVHMDGGLLST